LKLTITIESSASDDMPVYSADVDGETVEISQSAWQALCDLSIVREGWRGDSKWLMRSPRYSTCSLEPFPLSFPLGSSLSG
jgi:hypothetical protein